MTEINAIEREPALAFRRLLDVEQSDVRDRYLRFLLILIAVLAWIAALRWTMLYRTTQGGPTLWPALLGLLVTLSLSLALRRRTSLALTTALAGLGASVALEATLNPGLLPLLLLAPWVVLVSAATSTGILALAAAGGVALIVALAGRLPDHDLALAAGISLLSATVAAWIASRPIFDSLTMALYSASDAIHARDELRQQRQHLAQTVKMLDEALYRQSRLSTSLILARQQAEEARQLKVRFANMISHEIRTPLNIIISFSEVMANAPESYGMRDWPANLREDVNEIYRAGKHLLSLINDVLELAQVEANRVILKKERIPLLDVVEQAISLTRGWFDHAGLYLTLDTSGDIPDMLIDRVRIRQVLLNLLSNARHYTATGGVTVRVERLADEVAVSVRDTGTGIPKDSLQHLFDEFTQFTESVDETTGSGLGLAISRLFIQLHGGRMWAESAGVPGLGTTVFFTLPLSAASAVSESTDAGRDAEYWQSRYDQARSERVVLVAADDPTVAQVTTRLLSNQGRIVTSSVAGAPQVLSQHTPDAVVVLAEGRTLQHDVTNALRGCGAPVITCALDIGAGVKRLSSGSEQDINGWLIKPITRDDLIAALLSAAPNARTVLSIEDDAQMARFYEVALAREHRLPNSPRVVNVSRAAEVTGLLDEHLPDAILLDLNLGDASGWDVLAEIRKRWSSRELPVIVVTAMDRFGLPVLQSRDITVTRAAAFSQRETVLCLQNVLEAVLE